MKIKNKVLRKVIQPLVLVVVIISLVIFYIHNESQIYQIIFQTQVKWVPIVIVSIILSHFVQAFCWAHLTRSMGCQLSYARLIIIWYYSLLGLYIPGSIWMIVGRVYQLSATGFSKKKAIYTVGLEQIFSLAAAFFIVCITPQILNYINIPGYVGLIFAVLSLIVLFPNFWGKLIWKIGIRRIDFRMLPQIPFISLLIFFLGMVLSYYLLGLTFLFTLNLFDIYSSKISIFNATAMSSASFLIGYLAIITPNGIGVKEGVLSYFLIKYIPLPTAVLFAFSRRLWTLLAHFLTFPVAYLFLKRMKRNDETIRMIPKQEN